MSEKKVVNLLVNGGKATAGPPLGPALGPLGVNILVIVNKINELTGAYSGMKVPVTVTVDTETKDFEIEVGTPTTAALVVSELKIEKGSGSPGTESVGDLSMEQIIQIVRLKRAKLLSGTLEASTKEVLGSCLSLGVTIEGKDPRDVQREVDEGKYEHLFQEKET